MIELKREKRKLRYKKTLKRRANKWPNLKISFLNLKKSCFILKNLFVHNMSKVNGYC